MTVKYDPYSKTNQYIIDGVIVGLSFYAAYLIRFEGDIPPNNLFQFWVLLPVVVGGRLINNAWLGVYRRMWRYVSLTDAIQISVAYLAFSVFLGLLRLSLPDGLATLRIPLGVVAVEFSLSLLGALGVRSLRRLQYQSKLGLLHEPPEGKRTLLVGAGAAGIMTAKEIVARPDRKLVGFLDDNPRKIGALIQGVPVLGPLDNLQQIIKKHDVQEVVLCITRAPRNVLKRIWRLCEGLDVRTLIIPTLDEIFDGDVQISRLRQVNIENLLGRATVDLSQGMSEAANYFKGKRILVSGAGGSIGSELTRQLATFDPERLLLLDKDENSLFELQLQLAARSPVPRFELLVGDIRSAERIRAIFDTTRPEVVLHAAAHKHVFLMELNPSEAILNNVFGTNVLVEQAVYSGTELFVFISTDKAVRPSSVMGTSKRLAELVVQQKANQGGTRFACVRFGNVMGSRGSVIPLFQRQILEGGPITLTDPEVSRYFMTIPEAAQLVIQAGIMRTNHVNMFVLNMGDSVKVVDLARDLIELHGLLPDRDIKIETVGLRPGEKLREEFVGEDEEMIPTANPMIFAVASKTQPDWEAFERVLKDLWEAAHSQDDKRIVELLKGWNLRSDSHQPTSAGSTASQGSE